MRWKHFSSFKQEKTIPASRRQILRPQQRFVVWPLSKTMFPQLCLLLYPGLKSPDRKEDIFIDVNYPNLTWFKEDNISCDFWHLNLR